ncbi:MAG: hypothetical protein ACXU8U_13420 [Asticcacaulis sp.]
MEGYDWLRAYTGDAGDGSGGARRNMGHWMDAVKINPSDPNELIYGTGYGLWMTHDLGALDKGGMVNFDFADANFEETVILGLESPPSGARVLAAIGDVAGAGWDDVTKQPSRLFSPEYQTNQSVAYAALKPEIMARTADQAASSGFLSQDGGMSWTPMPASPRVAKDAQGRFHTSGKIAVSALGASLLWAPEGEGGYYSTDMGRTWTVSAGWPAAPDRNIDPIADKMTDGVFYVFDRTSNAVLHSADGGKSFAPFVTDLPRTETHQAVQLRAVPGRAGDLWLAAGAALMHSVDGKTSPVSGVDTAWQVAFGKAAPGHDYPAVYLWGRVGGVEGLWRSDDAGRTWNRINDDAHRFGVLRAMTGDPREYGVLYIAPDGRGVMVGRPK